MHVLILPSWYPADAGDLSGVFFREQAAALARSGIRTGVVAPGLRSLREMFRTQKFGRYWREDCEQGVVTLRGWTQAWLPSRLSDGRTSWLSLGQSLAERYISSHGRPDLVHVHGMVPAVMLADSMRRELGIPFVITEHSTAFARGALSPSQLALAEDGARHAERRIAVSAQLADVLVGRLGCACGLWEVIPNLVDARFLSVPLPASRPPVAKFRFLNVAMHHEKKGLDVLLEAFAMAFDCGSDVELVLAGDGPEHLGLRRRAEALGIGDRVRFLGALDRDEVIGAMAESDAFVLSSRQETFGVVLIEALAMGLPLVATRSGGPESIVVDDNGVLVDAEDAPALARALTEVLARARAGKFEPAQLRAACERSYGEQAVVGRLAKLYRDVVPDRRSTDGVTPGRGGL